MQNSKWNWESGKKELDFRRNSRGHPWQSLQGVEAAKEKPTKMTLIRNDNIY